MSKTCTSGGAPGPGAVTMDGSAPPVDDEKSAATLTPPRYAAFKLPQAKNSNSIRPVVPSKTRTWGPPPGPGPVTTRPGILKTTPAIDDPEVLRAAATLTPPVKAGS